MADRGRVRSHGTLRLRTVLAAALLGAFAVQASAALPEPQAFRADLGERPVPAYAPAPASDGSAALAGDADSGSELTRQILSLLPPEERARLRADEPLAHAARELAAFHVRTGRLAPGTLLTFLLDAGGAGDEEVRQSMLTCDPGDDARVASYVARLLGSETSGPWPFRIGIGEAVEHGGGLLPVRHVIVLLAPARLDLRAPLARRVEPGASAKLEAELAPGLELEEVLALGPALDLRPVSTRVEGRRVAADVAAGEARGPLVVQVIARSPRGPLPVAHYELHVGEPLPTRFEGSYPPDESRLDDDEEGARLVFALVNADRKQAGVAPLARSPALEQAAVAHSRDMREHDFVAHVSPRTGSVSDRVRARGYSYVTVGENVALDSSLWDAEQGLLRSLGHRRNLLSPQMTEVGIGVASRTDKSGSRTVWLTQVFARPSPRIDAAAARRSVLAVIGRARVARGLGPLEVSSKLEALAARAAARDSVTPHAILADLSQAGVAGTQSWATVVEISELGDVTVPDAALDVRYDRIGIGVHQDPGHTAPNIRIVIVLTEQG